MIGFLSSLPFKERSERPPCTATVLLLISCQDLQENAVIFQPKSGLWHESTFQLSPPFSTRNIIRVYTIGWRRTRRGAERALIEEKGTCREMKAPKVGLFSGPRAAKCSRSGASHSDPSSHCQEEPLSRHSGGTGWSTGPFQPGICWINGWMGKYFTGSTERSVRDKNTVSSVM